PLGHLACDGGKALDEFIQRIVVLQILKQRFYRHPCARKNRGPPENLGVNRYERVCRHVGSIADRRLGVNLGTSMSATGVPSMASIGPINAGEWGAHYSSESLLLFFP